MRIPILSRLGENKFNILNTILGYFLLGAHISSLFLWHRADQKLPKSDAAYFIYESQNIINAFSEGGASAGFYKIFMERPIRPTSNVVIGAGFLYLFGGDIERFTTWTPIFFFILLIVFLLKIEAFMFGNILFFPTLFLCSMPFVFVIFTGFYGETIFIPLLFASVYFLLKSENFKQFKPSLIAALLFALALTIRPVLGFLIYTPILLTIAIQGLANGRYSFGRVALTLIWPLMYVLFFLEFSQDQKLIDIKSFKYLIRLCALGILMLLEYKLFVKNCKIKYFFISIRVAIFIALIWFGTSIVAMYKWAYACSFGDLALDTGNVTTLSHDLSRALKSVAGLGSGAIWAGLILFFLVLLFIRKNILYDKAYVQFLRSKLPTIYMLFTAFAPIFIIFFISSTRDLRFVHVSIILLYFVSILLCFIEPYLRKVKVLFLLNLVMMFPIAAHIDYSLRPEVSKLHTSMNIITDFRYEIVRSVLPVNPTESIVLKIHNILRESGNPVDANIAILNINPFTPPGFVLNAFSMLIKKTELHLPLDFQAVTRIDVPEDSKLQNDLKNNDFFTMLKNLPKDYLRDTGSSLHARLDYLRKISAYVLIAPVNHPCPKEVDYSECGKGHHKNIDLGEWLVEQDLQGLLFKIGMKRLSSFSYYDYSGNVNTALLLVFLNKIN